MGRLFTSLLKISKKEHPETPWPLIEKMRHILVHDYALVISETLYDTAVNSVPEFRKQVEKYLAETDWNEWEKGEDLFNDTQDAVYKSIVGMAKNMRARGMSSEEIAEITGLSELEIEEL